MFDIIGDIHSCYIEFITLLEKLGYEYKDKTFKHPEGRVLVSVGDILDRGPHPLPTFSTVKDMVNSANMLLVRGNHCDKLLRWAKGNKVTLNHGLDKTVDILEKTTDKKELIDFFEATPYYRSLDGGKLIVVHASWRDNNIFKDPYSNSLKSDCLYGPTTGERDCYGLPVRINWAEKRVVTNDSPLVVYGHQMHREVYAKNYTIDVDTGCAFGGKLTALRYPELQFVQENSLIEYVPWIGEEGRKNYFIN
jgi:diadenosine tetraphosphatase ApaH/serine/threonine PP2A family protein phosphatase